MLRAPSDPHHKLCQGDADSAAEVLVPNGSSGSGALGLLHGSSISLRGEMARKGVQADLAA